MYFLTRSTRGASTSARLDRTLYGALNGLQRCPAGASQLGHGTEMQNQILVAMFRHHHPIHDYLLDKTFG
jgi:hypothetical protein